MTDAIQEVRRVPLQGMEAKRDLSAIVQAGDWLLLADDEGHRVHVLARDGAGWQRQGYRFLNKSGREADVEALSFADDHVYAIGSHSLRRRPLNDDGRTADRNRKHFTHIERKRARNRLYRLSLDSTTGTLGRPEHVNLSKRLSKDKLLAPFTRIPGKENGIDIEGIAARDGRLHIGLRGPVLRYNFVPVMVLEFDHPKRYELRLVQLDGQGIRDLVAVEDGFVLLAGPVNDAPGPFRLWHWDGADQMPGSDRVVVPARRLGDLEVPPGAKAEGLALVNEQPAAWDLLLLFDGIAGGDLRQLRVSRDG